MNKKMRLYCKGAVWLVLSAMLLGIPAAAFSMNGKGAMDVRAEDMKEGEGASEEKTESEGISGEKTEAGGTENKDVSQSDPTRKCVCEKKCNAYDYDKDCGVCSAAYKDCSYKEPNVAIRIKKPGGWHNGTVKVKFSVSDMARTGNFKVASIQAKVGQNGNWTDVTEDKELEVSENCTVYVMVTDQKGNTYERNRAVRCFDTTKPTLNAAVSGGLLSVHVYDTDSGAKAVYVNGYEFKKLTKGTLNIRLQQFDAGYEYFMVSAMDKAGNMSDSYQVRNPYYKDPATESNENPAGQLPENAEATEVGNATGTVTEHTRTDGEGNVVVQEEESQSVSGTEQAEEENSGSTGQSGKGKEFYTIQTATEKEFYLVIDRDGENETVYFLTEITENDLLHAAAASNETLPKNSAALKSAIPTEESALLNNDSILPAEQVQTEGGTGEDMEGSQETEEPEIDEPEKEAEEKNPVALYGSMGILAALFIGSAYYFKVLRKKKEGFLEDDEEDEEEMEEYEDDEGGEADSSGEDFF